MLKKKIKQQDQQDNTMIGILNVNSVLVIALTMSSCSNDTQEKKPDRINENLVEINPTYQESELKGYEKIFIYEDGEMRQILGVNYKKADIIEFSLNFEKKDGSCKVNIKGEAKNKNKNLDPELDEDEEGIAYPSNEFIYQKDKCVIALRIAMKEKDKAIIKTLECNDACLPETTGLLKLSK